MPKGKGRKPTTRGPSSKSKASATGRAKRAKGLARARQGGKRKQ